MGRVKSKFSWAKAIILFLSFLFIASTLGVSLSLFRDNTSDEQSNDFAPIVLSDNSFNTLKSQVSVDMLGKSILVQPVSFVVSKDTTSSIYVRAYVNFDGVANDARQKLAYESLTAATPVVGKSYKWTRFGQYYYLCDSSNQLVGLSASNAGEVFNLLEKETNIVPEDIVDDKFASGEKVSLDVTLQSVQTSKVSSKNVEQAHSAFNTVEPSLANTKTQCSVYFYDANGLSLGSQTVAYGKGVTIPTPASQTGKQLIGWNTKSDYTGATLDEEDLSSVYEDLVLYAEFDALTYNVTVIQPVDEVGNRIGTITPGNTTMRYGQSLTFRVIPNTNYYIYGVYIRNEQTNQVKNIGSVTEFVVNGYTSDITIWADISQEVIFLDINGGTGTQPRITFNEDKTKFVLSETEPVGPNGKEFYYYSTNPLDNEEGQNGIRIDLGVEYPLSYLEDNKVLYAIYLTPTENYQTATDYIVVPKNVTSIEGKGEKNMFGVDTPDVKFVTLPRSVKKIGSGAFRNLDGLTGLSMSTVVDSIGNYAFENCVSLEQFVFGPFVNKIGEGAFKNCVSLSTLRNFENIPTTEFVGTFEGCAMLTNVTLPSVTTKIEKMFKNCSNLLEIVLPEGLRNIGESSFENCTALSTIDIPDSVSFFGIKAFRNCVALTEVQGLANVVAVEIPDFMFENCVSLKEINIPSNTALIGSRAFNSCSAFEKITNLSLVKVGEVCEEAFANCSSLTELIFNGSLKIVGVKAFSNSSVKKVTLSQRLSSLGESAFEDCANLSTVQSLGIISTIPQNAFRNCVSLFSITIPATATSIDTLAFENCSSLSSLNIPASVQTISVDALKNAIGLKAITLQGDLASPYNLNSTKQNWYYNTIQVDSLNKKGYYTTIVSDWIVTNINGNNYITGYRGNKKDVSIPYTITNEVGETTYIYGVALGQYTDSSFQGFENVVIEEGIQAIFNIDAKNAVDNSNVISYPCFKGMKTLKSITLPSTMSSISSGAFAGCSNLTEVVGLENTKITKLGDIVPFKTSSIMNYDDLIIINGSEIRIKYNDASDNVVGVFQETAIKEIKLPANLQIIGTNCFIGVPVTEITIPATVRCIGSCAFVSMERLETISGLENCVLDYKATINNQTVDCGFAAFLYMEGTYYNYPVFGMLPMLKTLSLPSYATIYAGNQTTDGSTNTTLITQCPSLETIIMIGDWPQEFSLATSEESDFGINSYQWYLNGKQVTSAMEAGTYTIFPGSDDSEWVVDENGMIIAYKGSNTTVTVPASVVQNGKTVQVVGVKSFKNSVLMNVTLSEGITKIDSGAFANMTKLKSIKFAKTISEIGDKAFENCSSLVSVVLPENTKTVGSDIFIGCSSIKIIVLNNNISTEQNLANISDGDWFYQSNATSVVVSSMKSKGIYSKYSSIATTNEWEVKAYDGKNYITAYLGSSREITVPALVVENDYSKIYEIYGLAALKKFNFTSIIISEGIEALGLNINEDQMEQAFSTLGLMDPETYAIDAPFMRAGEGSDLKFNESLTKFVLPDSLDVVGFYGLTGLKLKGLNTVIELKNISVLGMGALGLTEVDEIRVNLSATKTLLSIGGDAFTDSSARIITIGYGPTTIGNSAFRNCANLTELNLPASIVTIGDSAFSGCSSLKVLNLRNARQIGSISDCSSLEKIILGASLYSPYAVSNISGKNGSTWFYEGGSDTAVSYFDLAGTYVAEKPDLSTVWTYEQINGKWYITGYTGNSVNLTVPSSLVINGTETQIAGIKSINTNEGVDIETLVISEGIAEILENALSGKTKLSSITLPQTLTSIGANAFSGTIIKILTLGCDSLTLSAGALDGMSELEIINVQNGVNSSYVLPTNATWTYIYFDEANNKSSSSSTTTLLNKGIYTTLANVATTNEWIVGSENDSYFIAGYKLDYTDSTKILEIPRLVINHKTFEVYEISSIKSLFMQSLSNYSVEISLKVSEGITKIDTKSYSYSFNDVTGEYFSINQSLSGNGNNIVSIELPTTLLELGDYAFANLNHLKEIKNLENTQIKELKQNAFYNNYDLTQLVFPITLKEINSNNFSSCSDLNKITLKTNLNSTFNLSNVGNGIWYYNTETVKTLNMQKAGIYSSSPMQNIGLWVVELIDGKNYITAYLGGATELVVPHELFDEQRGETVQIYGVRGIGKSDLVSISFEEGIEEIGENTASLNIFGGECPYLEKISMPSTLTTIYEHALDGISAENIVITIFGSQKKAYTLSAIKNTTWYYGKNEVSTMQKYGSYMTFKVEAYMPDETTMGKLVSENAAKRNEIVKEAGYGDIDNAWYVIDNETDGKTWYMYGYLGSKSEIVVPHYVMDYFTIANVPIMREISCFLGLVKDALTQEITKITLEEGYTTFGVGEAQEEINAPAMTGSMGTVKDVVLPSTLTKLGVAAFVGFTSLENINLEDTKLTSISMYAFAETLNLKKVKLPETLKKLEMLAFYGSGLTELELNEGLVSLDAGALSGLANLKVLTISSTVLSIQQNVLLFTDAGETLTLSSLEKIVIKKDLTTALAIETITKNVYYKNGSQIALSTISEAGTYLSYICGTTDDWRYETVGGKNYITAYVGKNVVVDVPTYIWDRSTGDTIEIYGVKSLNNSKIRKLTIREGVKSVGNGTNNIINGTYNNTLTYVSIASSVIENDAHILDDCFALESINLFGNLQNELTTSSIKPSIWHSHNVYLKNILGEGSNDEVTAILLAGGYSTYSIGQNIVQVKPAQGGFGGDLWMGETGTNVDAFVPAFGLFMPQRITPSLIETISQEQMAQFVPMNSVISLRGFAGTKSEVVYTVAQYNSTINFNSITFAEGITRIGDKGNKNNGLGAAGAVYALGPVVNKVNKVGSEDKINLLSFDGSFESSVPSAIAKDGGTLSLSNSAYAGSKALSYSKSGASKATITTQLETGVYVFEAMVKSSNAGAPLQVQLSSSGSNYSIYYSDVHIGDGNYQYVFVKFEVQSSMAANLNLIQSATYDCMSLYRVDRGLPTTLTVLGANAFSVVDSKGNTTGLSSINLSQTAIEEIEMLALNATFENSGLSDYQYSNGKYTIGGTEVRTDWSFDAKTNTLTIANTNITMVESSEEMFWGGGYTYNAKTNRLTTPDGSIYTDRYFTLNGELKKDVVIAIPRSLTTLGHMALNTGATRYIGLEKSAFKSMEVSAFGGTITDVFGDGTLLTSEKFADNLVEINLPKTFEDITYSTSSDIVLGPMLMFNMGSISDDGQNFHFPTNFVGYGFAGNRGLQNINVDSQNAVFSSKDGVLFNSNQSTIISFPIGRVGNYEMPDSVKTVGEAAFITSSLSSVTISSSLEEIQDYGFAGTTISSESIGAIAEFVGLENSKLKIVGRGAFAGISVRTLSFPDTLVSVGDTEDLYGTPFGGGVSGENPILELIITRSALTKPVSLAYNASENGWYYNFSSKVEYVQPAGIYSNKLFERDWKIEQIDGKYWIVAYLGEETNLSVPSVTLNDMGELVEIYGIKSINYSNVSSLDVASGIKAFGYAGDSTNILGSTSDNKLASIEIKGRLLSMTENSLLGLNELSCLTLAMDLDEANSFAPTGRTAWYHYNNGVSEIVSTYQKAGIYTSSQLQRENEEWVVDSDGYIIAYTGTKTELVVPSHLLKQNSDEVIIVKGIKSFKSSYMGDTTVLGAVTSVTISEGLKTIEDSTDGAFQYLKNLVEINLSSTINYIGENAFKNCEVLSEITIPSGVKEIAVSALPMDKNLSKITLEGNLKTIFNISDAYGSWFYNNEPTATDTIYIQGVYNKLRYTIVYDGNGATLSDGSTSFNQENVLQGKEIVLADNSFISSSIFLGWSTDADSLYGEYQAGQAFTLSNTENIKISDYKITFYAIWQKMIGIITLENEWTESHDADRGYAATKFGNTTYIGADVSIDLSKEIIMTGSFKLSTLGRNTKLISLMSGSTGIELYANSSNKLELRQNNSVVMTSTNALTTSGFSYFIYKSYNTIKIKVLNENGGSFFEQSVTSKTMTGTSARYTLGYSNNSTSVTYGTAMLFESIVLKLEYMPIANSGTTMLKITEDRKETTTSLSNTSGASASTINVVKMIPTSEGSILPKENIPTRFGYTFGGYISELGTTIYDENMNVKVASYPYIGDKTLTAQWTPIDYTITYDANGGTGSYTQTVRFDDTFESYGANQSIKRTGYSIVGWATDKAGTNVKYEPGKKDCIFDNKGNLTLYAKWSANQYNYTYVAGSGTGTAYTDKITYDQAFTFLSSSDAKLGFSKTGYSFAGWVDSNGKTWGLDWVGKSWTWTGDNYAKDITFTAQWTPNTYKVTLNNQSATTAGTTAYWYIYETYKNGIYYYADANCTTKLGTDGATITKPTRTGYTFGGYYTGTNGSGTQYVNANGVTVNNMYSTVAKDTTLYAKWTANTYTVTTNANGGTIPATSGWTVASDGATATKTMTYDANYGTLPAPTRTGYTFGGWTLNGKVVTSSTKMQTASNHTLTASWKANNYTVSFNANGGTVSPTSKSVTFDQAYGTLPTPTKTGYTFVGWTNSVFCVSDWLIIWSGSTNQGTSSINRATNSVTLTATGADCYTNPWNGADYRIKVSPSTTYLFSWKQSAQNSAVQHMVFLYDSQTASSYTGGNSAETYDSATGRYYIKFTTASTTNYVGFRLGIVGASGTTLTFSEIKLEESSTATAYLTTNTTIVKTPKNHTLYAEWTPITYTIKYNGNGNTSGSTSDSTHTYDVAKNLTANGFAKTGYTFAGWATSASGSVAHGNSASVKNLSSTQGATVTLYAKWTANQYTVTANANGGTIPTTSGWTIASGSKTATKSVTYDSTYGTLPTPTRTGYTFAGWWTAASNGTQITSSTKVAITTAQTLYAHWTANTYTVTLNSNDGTYLSKTSLTIAASETGNWNYQSVSSGVFAPNTTYVLKIGTATRTAGSATNFQVRIYDFTTNAERATATAAFGSNVSITLKTSSSLVPANNNQIIIYAGVSGSTAGVAATFNNISLTVAKTVTFDSTYGDLPNPTRAGYTFAGWSKNMFNPASAYDYTATTTRSDGTFTFNTGSTNTSSLAFQIQTWSNSSYLDTFIATSSTGIVSGVLNKTASIAKLRFKYNGNSADAWFYYDISDLPDGKYVIQVNVTTMQMNKIVINNIMIEQNSSNTRSTYVSSSTHVTATSKVDEAMNRTLFAQWSGVSYTLTFSQNGGSGGALSSTSYTTSHNTQTITITEPTRAGWTRTGWTVSGNNGSATASGTTLTIAGDTYGNITVTPVWTGKTYTITWSANGGTGGKVSKTSYTVSASSQTATITAPTRTGWNVSSYSVSGNTGTASVSGTTLTIAANTYGNLTVKANWTPKSWTLSKSTYVTVNRTSSPNQGASTGTLGNGETIYYGDVLSFTSKAGTFSRNGRTYQQHINATIKYYTSVGGTQTSTEYSDKVNGAALRAGLTVYGAVTVTASRNQAYRSVWTGNVSTGWIRNGSATIGSGSFGNAGADFIAYGTSYHASGKVTFGTQSNQDGSNSFTNVASWSGGTVHASWWANWEMSCSSSGVYFKGSDMGAYYGKGYVTQIFAYY